MLQKKKKGGIFNFTTIKKGIFEGVSKIASIFKEKPLTINDIKSNINKVLEDTFIKKIIEDIEKIDELQISDNEKLYFKVEIILALCNDNVIEYIEIEDYFSKASKFLLDETKSEVMSHYLNYRNTMVNHYVGNFIKIPELYHVKILNTYLTEKLSEITKLERQNAQKYIGGKPYIRFKSSNGKYIKKRLYYIDGNTKVRSGKKANGKPRYISPKTFVREI